MKSTLAQQLRQAIREADETPHGIAIQTGIDHSLLSRFLRAERDLRLETAGKIAAHLKLELRAVRKPKRKARR
jgi:hypothetical protein